MPATAPTYRIASIDILRGLIMIIMALDHTRDFFHESAMLSDPLNAQTTTPLLFFTRWITHYCAPGFVFLSGLSAWLSSKRKTKAEASLFLIKRGAWLLLVEITLVSFGLTFNPSFNFIILQVIWVIGWSMILLGLIMRISYLAVLISGAVLFAGHNIFDYFSAPASESARYIMGALFTSRGMVMQIDATHFVGIFYAILPWTAIMFLGYGMGAWFRKDFPAEKRKRRLLITGSLAILTFIVLRLARGYGDPGAWDGETLYSFLNTSKYPPSIQFACMTLGPSLILLAIFEDVNAAWSGLVSVYGRVPFFYFILHLYLIHLLTLVVFFAAGNGVSQIADPQSIFLFRPVNFGYDLWVVYLVWLIIVLCLYWPCRWFSRYKQDHRQWWLSYV